MLVLTRSPEKSIFLDHPDGAIVIKFLDVDRNTVRVGIEAPKTVIILRDDAKSTAQMESN